MALISPTRTAKREPVFLPDLLTQDIVNVAVGHTEEQKVFTIHKALLCRRSSYFDAAFNGTFVEASANKLVLDDVSPDIFKCFIFWLYTSELPKAQPDMFGTSSDIVFLRLFALGDRLFVPDMQDLCWIWLREHYYATETFPDPAFLKELYTLTDHTSRLREYFVHMCVYLIAENKEAHVSWDDILDSNETFAAEVAKKLAKRMGSPDKLYSMHPYTLNTYVHFREEAPPQALPEQRTELMKSLMGRVKDLAFDSRDSRTFTKWPHPSPSTQAMIAAGWIHQPTSTSGNDRVICLYCGQSTFNWKPEHDPLERHRFWSPKCAFVKVVDAGVLPGRSILLGVVGSDGA